MLDVVPPLPSTIFCCPIGFNMEEQSETESPSQESTEYIADCISSVAKHNTLDPDVAEFIPMGRTNDLIATDINTELENNQENHGK